MVAPFPPDRRHAPALFLVNSQSTADELRRFCREDAEILLYRPRVRNVFAVSDGTRERRPVVPGQLKLIAIGTIEPRKNLFAAASILAALRSTSHPQATLDIVGRPGWGVDTDTLAGQPGVTVHGYQPTDRVQALIEAADALICTSHDEGLGLPLLEAQYAGLPIIAPDAAVFQEVLGQSGLLFDAADLETAAVGIGAALSGTSWRHRYVAEARSNLSRWNGSG